MRTKSYLAGSVAVILVSLLSLQAAAEGNAIVIRGAGSMLHLCQQLVSLYKQDVTGVSVGVNVADSIDSLAAGGNSIWQTVRPLDKSQKEQLLTKFGSEAHEIPIAIEGVVVIVHPSNHVNDLTVAQLRGIFTGKITNWKDVGGVGRPIRLYSTEAMVGGSLFFTDFVLHGEDIDTTMQGFNSPKDTEHAVAQDAGGIGLIPMPGDKDVKYPRIRRFAESPGIDASIENIRTMRYPLSTQVYWVIAGQHPEFVTQLVRFTLSQKGQLAAEAAGYYPLNPAERTIAMAASIPAKLSH